MKINKGLCAKLFTPARRLFSAVHNRNYWYHCQMFKSDSIRQNGRLRNVHWFPQLFLYFPYSNQYTHNQLWIYFVRIYTDAVKLNTHGCTHTMPVGNKQPWLFLWERKAYTKEKKMTKRNRIKSKTFKFKYFNLMNTLLRNLKLKVNILKVETHKCKGNTILGTVLITVTSLSQ